MRTAKTLIRLGRCLGRSVALLGAQVILLILSCGASKDLEKIETNKSSPKSCPAHRKLIGFFTWMVRKKSYCHLHCFSYFVCLC